MVFFWITMIKIPIFHPASSNYMNYIKLGLAFIVQLIIGFPYTKNFYFEVFKWRRVGMNTLVSLSNLLSFFYSLYIVILNALGHYEIRQTFFEVGVSIITILMIGDLISNKLRKNINNDFDLMNNIVPDHAHLIIKIKTYLIFKLTKLKKMIY